MKTAFFSECDYAPCELKSVMRKAIRLALNYKNLKTTDPYEVSIIFVDEARIRKINNDFRHIDRATDVISFAFADGVGAEFAPYLLGDIFICTDVVASHAGKYGTTFDEEMTFMVVHGILHLLGFDHHKKREREDMRIAENVIMKQLFPQWKGRGEEYNVQ